MPGIVDRSAPAELPRVIGHQGAVLSDQYPFGIRMHLYRPADGARLDGIFVVVEPDQTVRDTEAGWLWNPSNGPA